MSKFGVIGAGKMATAILDGALGSGYLTAGEVVAYDTNPDSMAAMAGRGITCATSLQQVAGCQYILLSVKPQVAPTVLAELDRLVGDSCTIISIAAGVTAAAIAGYMGKSLPTVLVMPNTPIMVGLGAAAVCRTGTVSDESFDFAKGLFAAAGVVDEIPSDKMNEIIAVHGSTPAYVYLITKCFCDYAAGQGIPFDVANRLFCQTLTGAARMMTETGLSHQQLIDMVTSPGGTTLAGLQSLEHNNLKKVIDDCCDATIARAYELGKAK